MFGTDPVLRPAAEVAQIIAHWSRGLRSTMPPSSAPTTCPSPRRIYFDDMYVPQQFSVRTARAIRGLQPWVTNEYEHDGLRVSSGAVLDRLIGLARGTI